MCISLRNVVEGEDSIATSGMWCRAKCGQEGWCGRGGGEWWKWAITIKAGGIVV
jgi:hypothetical protein